MFWQSLRPPPITSILPRPPPYRQGKNVNFCKKKENNNVN